MSAASITCRILVAAAWLLRGPGALAAGDAPYAALCIDVVDGDTLEVVRAEERITIRLFGVDAPEWEQPFGREAARAARRLLDDRRVIVEPRDVDRLGRTVARVRVGGKDAGLELVRAGMAWHFTRFSSERALSEAEAEARAAGRGLWSGEAPTPPWDWRQAHPREPTAPPDPGTALHGNTRSRVFHQASCAQYLCPRCTERFPTRDAALAAGYRPCGTCRP